MNRALFSRDDAAQYLGISVRTLDRLTQSRLVISVSRGHGCRRQYRQQDLDAYIHKHLHRSR